MKKREDVDRTISNFKEDTSIHPYFRSTLADYKHSGFDRGHLAAAANHRMNQDLCDETFLLSNMAPQVKTYSLIQYKGYNSKFKFFDGIQFRKYFISLPAFCLII